MAIPERIAKPGPAQWIAPRLIDYESARAGFSWTRAAHQLSGLPGHAGLNIAHEAVDRHALGPRSAHVALRWLGKAGARHDITYDQLGQLTSRFANALRWLGVAEGERVFVLAGRIPELYVAVLGALKNQCVVSPLFSAFGPEPIHTRLTLGEGVVLVTTESLYQKKVAPIRDRLPKLRHVLVAREGAGPVKSPGALDLHDLLESASPEFHIHATSPETPALLHFTSGTTGKPKGALHVHGAVLAHHVTGQLALDLHTDDVFWCTADPGWVTGTSYGIISPLTNGVTRRPGPDLAIDMDQTPPGTAPLR